MELRASDSLARFSPEGDLLEWSVAGRSVLLDRPMRQNARAEWQGIQLWVKSAKAGEEKLLPAVEYGARAVEIEAGAGNLTVVRQGEGWRLELLWRLEENELHLAATIHAEGQEKFFQIELLCWAPFETPERGRIEGRQHGEPWSCTLPRFGRVQVVYLDDGSPIAFQSAMGRRLEVAPHQQEAATHLYHRGMTVKLGSASGVAAPGSEARLDVCFTVCEGRSQAPPPISPRPAPPVFSQAERRYPAGLMLHLQYTQHSHTPDLLERWFGVTRRLGFDFILLEINRALRIHPACADEALGLEVYARLAEKARAAGLELIPCYNLLGHQYETGLLDWHPEWRETQFDGLCVTHPEVRAFAASLITDVLEAFQSPWIHIGGDELKLPYDGLRDDCPRCGTSPNLEAIVGYWNFLQSTLPEGKHLAIWGDQLLPPGKIAPGLTGHYWGSNAAEILTRLDRRITIVDWQYSAHCPDTSQQFLRQAGHSVALASGQYAIENPFLHAATCRKAPPAFALHTTWASPHPADCPLESVAAAARAHAGERFEPRSTPALCARDAEWLYENLLIRGMDTSYPARTRG